MPLLEATFRQSFSTLLEAMDDISLHTRLEAKASLISPLEAKGDLLSALLTGTGSASPCPLDLSEVIDLYAQIQPTLLDGVRSEWTGVTVQTFATRLCCEPANMTGLTVRESQSGPVTRETRAYTQEGIKGATIPCHRRDAWSTGELTHNVQAERWCSRWATFGTHLTKAAKLARTSTSARAFPATNKYRPLGPEELT